MPSRHASNGCDAAGTAHPPAEENGYRRGKQGKRYVQVVLVNDYKYTRGYEVRREGGKARRRESEPISAKWETGG